MSAMDPRLARLTDEQRAALLRKLQEAAGPARPAGIEPVPRTGAAVDLSSTQERMWFLDQFAPGSAFHNMSGVAQVPVPIEPEAFGRCLGEVVQRHEILRMSFGVADGSPVGLIADEVPIPVRIVEETDQEALGRAFLEDARRPFDLRAAPLLRLTVAPVGLDACLIQLTMHHLISDGFSNGILLREVGELYQSHVMGVSAKLPELPFQFADYAHWERAQYDGGRRNAALAYWEANLAGAAQRLSLAADMPRPPRMTYRGGRTPIEVPAKLAALVKERSTQNGVTPFVTMLAAYAVLLQRHCLQDDIVIGIPVANRDNAGTEGLIGPFLNTIAVRCDLDGDPSFAALAAQLQATALKGFEHQAAPFDKVLQAVGVQRDPSRSPLFQTVFNFQADRAAAAGTSGIELRDVHNGTCQFDLLLSLFSGPDTVTGHIDFYADAFSREWVERFAAGYLTVLEAFMDDWDLPIGKAALLSPAETAALVAEARGPRVEEAGRCVHELVIDQARSQPDRIALVDRTEQITYRQLDERTAALAALLRKEVGDEPGAHIGIHMPRSLDMVIGLIAILRAGYSYVPLDPSYPAERLAFMCADGNVTALMAAADDTATLPGFTGPIFRIDKNLVPDAGTDAGLPDTADPDSRAYTIYTSGSTGKPKGVQVSHRNIVNFLSSMRAEPGLAPDDVLLAVTSLSFDIAVLELLLPLTTGATAVIASPADVVDGRRLAALLEKHKVTIMQATPTSWQLMLDGGWTGRPGLRVLCGGEAISPALAESLLPRCGELWNMYGPTETTVWSTIHRVGEADLRRPSIPIGHTIRNTSAYVLDGALNPVPPGVPGELCLGGDGVAIGYLGRPELTAEKFIEAPFDAGSRLYRTGDLVSRRPDGVFEFLGRLDHQVKVRGFRIEPGEIENTLERHAEVSRAVVVEYEDFATEKSLVAYVERKAAENDGVDKDRDENEAKEEDDGLAGLLLDWLRDQLPVYMIPARILVVEAFPLTPNGKIDRKSLPRPAKDAAAAARSGPVYVAPRDDMETRLAAVWEELLGISPIGVDDNFFEIGGHSLLATKLVFRIREAIGIELPLQALFDERLTIARMAHFLVTGPPSDEEQVGPQDLDLHAEAELDPLIRPAPGAHVHSVRDPQNVFFTGATGFVGAFLLAELLDSTSATVFCLVRASSEADGFDRIRQSLDSYGIWKADYGPRIIAILGDLARPALGLSRAQWQHLAAMVDVIHHCGAEVNFLRPYPALKPANVLGTQEVLRLACEGSVKPVHFVSSTYVFSRFHYPPGTEFTEDMIPVQDLVNTFGYTQSKWVGERMVVEAGRRGLPVYVYRAGRVAGHSETGACQTYDFVWQATKVGIEMQAAPVMDMSVDITPVDFVVKSLVHLSRQPDLAGQAFHLVSKAPLPESELIEWVEKFGYQGGRRLTFPDWCSAVVARAADLDDRTAGALAPFLSGTLPLDRIPAARFDTRNVDEGLRGTDIVCHPIDDRLLRLYFEYFIETGYLPPPASGDASTSTREVFA